MTVAKLRGARERKRRQAGWCEGGAPLHVRFPEAVRLAKRLHGANPVTGQRRSLRKISAELAGAGNGRPCSSVPCQHMSHVAKTCSRKPENMRISPILVSVRNN